MTEQPHLKREVLEWVYEEADGPCDVVHLDEMAEETSYQVGRLAQKASETGVLTCGVNMRHPFYTNTAQVEAKLEEYND